MTDDSKTSIFAGIVVAGAVFAGLTIAQLLLSGHEGPIDRCVEAGGIAVSGVSKWVCLNSSAIIELKEEKND